MNPDRPLTEAERFPLLSEAGRRRLRWLQEHPHAPRWLHQCGERLDRESLARVRAFAERVQSGPTGWSWGERPPWVEPFARFCLDEVPIYRRNGGAPEEFSRLPTVGHDDLRREPWTFVPDSQPLDDLVVYWTSGTMGSRAHVLMHVEVPPKYLPLLERALATQGVRLEGGSERVSILHVCAQQSTYTLATVSSYLDEAGYAKTNLNPADWRDPMDRVAFLDSCDPEIYTGDPLSFAELMKLPLRTRPKALISTAMALVPAFREELGAHFGCPVLDIYSLTESGPVALATERGYEILPPDLYVEVIDAEGHPCPPGVGGEITLTGGRNPFLPLLRYRTGDWASIEYDGGIPRLIGVEGRPPVAFRGADGRTINNIDVTMALDSLPLIQYTLHQDADGALHFRVRGDVGDEPLRKAVLTLFGHTQRLTIEPLPDSPTHDKLIQYTRDVRPD
jgi:phenylacetate-CoA ligase